MFILALGVRLFDRDSRTLLDEGTVRRLWVAGRMDDSDDFLDVAGAWRVQVNVLTRKAELESLRFALLHNPRSPYLTVRPGQGAGHGGH